MEQFYFVIRGAKWQGYSQSAQLVRVLQTWCQRYALDPPEGQCASLHSLALDSISPMARKRLSFFQNNFKISTFVFVYKSAHSFFPYKLLITIIRSYIVRACVCCEKNRDSKDSRLFFLCFSLTHL